MPTGFYTTYFFWSFYSSFFMINSSGVIWITLWNVKFTTLCGFFVKSEYCNVRFMFTLNYAIVIYFWIGIQVLRPSPASLIIPIPILLSLESSPYYPACYILTSPSWSSSTSNLKVSVYDSLTFLNTMISPCKNSP